MANEKRLIDANALIATFEKSADEDEVPFFHLDEITQEIFDAPTVDAVEVVRIEEVKKEILQGFDVLIAEYQRISQSSKDYFGIKADAMEIARRLVNAALTDLCPNCGAKMDGDGNV